MLELARMPLQRAGTGLRSVRGRPVCCLCAVLFASVVCLAAVTHRALQAERFYLLCCHTHLFELCHMEHGMHPSTCSGEIHMAAGAACCRSGTLFTRAPAVTSVFLRLTRLTRVTTFHQHISRGVPHDFTSICASARTCTPSKAQTRPHRCKPHGAHGAPLRQTGPRADGAAANSRTRRNETWWAWRPQAVACMRPCSPLHQARRSSAQP